MNHGKTFAFFEYIANNNQLNKFLFIAKFNDMFARMNKLSDHLKYVIDANHCGDKIDNDYISRGNYCIYGVKAELIFDLEHYEYGYFNGFVYMLSNNLVQYYQNG